MFMKDSFPSDVPVMVKVFLRSQFKKSYSVIYCDKISVFELVNYFFFLYFTKF